MFERYVGCKTGAIIEIDPSNSLAVLTVSRDQLKYNHQYELNAFISEISIDNKSLTRDCAVNKTEIYGEFKRIGKNPSHMPEENSKVLLPQATITGTSETKWYSDSGSVCGEGQALVTSTPHAFSVHYEDAPKKMGRAARQFHKDKIKGNRLKLLLAWNETIQFFLETLYDIYNEEVIYLPGFVFGVDISGLHKSEKLEKEEGHIIYLNPIDINGRIAISHKDTERLYAIGAHELAHIRCTYHDEYYAGVLTLLMERTVAKLPELKARIKKAVKQINPP